MDNDLRKILLKFKEESRPLVEKLITEWPSVKAGSRELIFMAGSKSVFRAGPYDNDHLIVRNAAGTTWGADLVRRFHGKELQKTISIPLNNLNESNISTFISMLRP